MKERTISYAYDNITGSLINIDDSVSSHKEGFSLRDDYGSNTDRFSCVECRQRLVVSHSSRDNVYFRHLPKSNYCLLKDNNLSDDVFKGYKDHAFARESQRHKELKNKIGQLLHYQEGVEISSIDIDSKFIIRGDQRRRPDVFCLFKGKSIAFEIQLSYLPPHYIKHRYEFYQKNNIYLIWILDTTGPLQLKTFERDLKYIWPHQNLFQLDEANHSSLKIVCHFKQPFVFENSEIRQKWSERSVGLSELIFKESDFSIYYFDYGNGYLRVEQSLLTIQNRIREEQIVENRRIREERNKRVILGIIAEIQKFRDLDYNFYGLIQKINNLDFLEIQELNEIVKLGSKKNGVPLFLYYIKEYRSHNPGYKNTIADLLLGCINFKFDINLSDENGNGIIEYLYLNKHLKQYRFRLLYSIFNRGYILRDRDRVFLATTVENGEMECFTLNCFSYCDNQMEMEAVRSSISYLLFIESANQGKRINSNLKNWIQYMMPVMNGYRGYWTYTKIVLSKTNLGKELKLQDKKGTIKKKIIEFDLEQTPQNDDIINPLMKLYPEIFGNMDVIKIDR